MTHKTLYQLYYLKKEILELKNQLQILESGADTCSSHMTGLCREKNKKGIDELAIKVADLKFQIEKCESEQRKIESYIKGIDDSLIRQILKYKYERCWNWIRIANKIGGGNTPDGIRKRHDRFLEKNNKI